MTARCGCGAWALVALWPVPSLSTRTAFVSLPLGRCSQVRGVFACLLTSCGMVSRGVAHMLPWCTNQPFECAFINHRARPVFLKGLWYTAWIYAVLSRSSRSPPAHGDGQQ
jgi:hypothetical protein